MKFKNIYGDKKTGKILFEAGILIMVVNLLCAIGIWQSISNDWKVTGGGELFFQAFIRSDSKYTVTYLNQESFYISFLSVLFSFLGNKEELVSIINLILQLAGIGFFYLGAKKLFGFVYSLAVAVLSGILSGCFYSVTIDSSMHLIWFLSGLTFWMLAKAFCDVSGLYRKHILIGILLGILCYVDFAGVFFLVICILFTFTAKEFSSKEKSLQLLCFTLCVVNGFFCMFYLWNNFLFNTVVFGQWFRDKTKYFKPESCLNQYISLMIILGISVVFYIIKHAGNVVSPLAESDSVFQQITEQEVQETDKPIKFLENPLPVPKKHVRKEMDYAFEPSKEQMHYDLNNYKLDDDYDLKD